jgi:hypothetical protein
MYYRIVVNACDIYRHGCEETVLKEIQSLCKKFLNNKNKHLNIFVEKFKEGSDEKVYDDQLVKIINPSAT